MSKNKFKIKVLRTSSAKSDVSASLIEYEIPALFQMSVLDALKYIKDNIDETFAFHYSCEKQRCGSCALQIDETISLACYTPLKDGQKITPLPGFKVEKDLAVDWSPYEARMKELIPGALSNNIVGNLTQRRMDLSESAMTCIKCFSCVGACPSVDIFSHVGFAGPAISVMLGSYLDKSEDSKDLLFSISNSGLEYCTRCYACNDVCPAEINIVGCIQELETVGRKHESKMMHLRQMTSGFI